MRRASTIAMLVAGLAYPVQAGAAGLPDLAVPESDARALALAGTGTAVAAGAGAVWWNPAGLVGGSSSELLLSHVALSSGLALQSGVFTLRPIAGSSLVVALQADLLREQGIPVPEVAPGLRAVPPRAGYRGALHVAGGVGRGVALGAAVGRMRGLPGMPDPGPRYVADAGLRWRHAGTQAGLALRGAALGGDAAGSPVLSAGVAQAIAGDRLLGTVHLERDRGGDLHPASGFEWRVAPGLELRAGARYEDAERGTSGAGGFRLHHDRLHLDYALRALRGARTVHALTLGFDLGSPPPPPSDAPEIFAPGIEDASPRLPRRSAGDAAARSAAPADERLAVRAGPYPNIETASEAILRLRRVDLRPAVQQQGEEYFLVVDRGLSRLEAEMIQALAGRAGVRCVLIAE